MKFKESLTMKSLSIFFSYVLAIVLVLSVLATVAMGYYKFYFSEKDALKEEILTDMAQSEAYHISNLLDGNVNLERYYKDKNVFFKVSYKDDSEIITNYNSEQYIAYATAEHYFYDEQIHIDEYGNEHFISVDTHIADVEVFIARDMKKNDLFSATSKIIDIGYNLRYATVFIVLFSLAGLIFLLCYLYCAAGHTKNGEIKHNFIDKIPFDLLTAIVATLAFFSIYFIGELAYDLASAILVVSIIGTIDYFIALVYTMSIATRIKTETLVKNNVITYILKFIGKYFKKFFNWIKFVFNNASVLQKIWVIVLIIVVTSFIFTISITYNLYDAQEFFLIFMMLLTLAIVLTMLFIGVIMQRIKSGGEKIASGDLEHKIDTKYMFWDFREFAESLNNITYGLQTAVNEKMKSERFKTELITNVSHDIKTPLTSIINYVDLIKKEEIKNDTVNGYIEVLDRQSLRLKKLVEDLVEASKASTGNLAVEFAPCNVGVLIAQTVGEWTERFEKEELIPIANLPKNDIIIMADGRHLWRVFDNLMSNICKYALNGTRVYIDVDLKGEETIIEFKNISKFQLDVSEDELMERFVRGDASRNTEGSGLGLSIAKSLTELQNGKLDIKTDGDLFKVTLVFTKA